VVVSNYSPVNTLIITTIFNSINTIIFEGIPTQEDVGDVGGAKYGYYMIKGILWVYCIG